MDKLPTEILDKIICYTSEQDDYYALRFPHLASLKIAQYAAVSKRWQVVVEARTFRCIQLRWENFDQAIRILTPERRTIISAVNLQFLYKMMAKGTRNTSAITHFDQASFENELFWFLDATFEILHHIVEYIPRIRLILDIKVEWDRIHDRQPEHFILDPQHSLWSLPELPNVLEFSMPEHHEKMTISPSYACRLAKKMPNLSELIPDPSAGATDESKAHD